MDNIIDEIISKISINKLKKIIIKYWGTIPFLFYAYGGDSENKIIQGDYNSFILFLKENSFYVNTICSDEYKKRKLLLSKLLKVYKLKDISLDDIFDYIIKNGKYSIIRDNIWEKSEKAILSHKSKNDKIIYHSTCYNEINGFGHKKLNKKYWIYSYHNRIIWIDSIDGHYSSLNPDIFVVHYNNIYGLIYGNQRIIIYSDFSAPFKEYSCDNLDDVLIKYNEKH